MADKEIINKTGTGSFSYSFHIAFEFRIIRDFAKIKRLLFRIKLFYRIN